MSNSRVNKMPSFHEPSLFGTLVSWLGGLILTAMVVAAVYWMNKDSNQVRLEPPLKIERAVVQPPAPPPPFKGRWYPRDFRKPRSYLN